MRNSNYRSSVIDYEYVSTCRPQILDFDKKSDFCCTTFMISNNRTPVYDMSCTRTQPRGNKFVVSAGTEVYTMFRVGIQRVFDSCHRILFASLIDCSLLLFKIAIFFFLYPFLFSLSAEYRTQRVLDDRVINSYKCTRVCDREIFSHTVSTCS